MSSGTIYLIMCDICGDEYIGETGRPLCVRIKEHLDGKRKIKENTPLGAHRIRSHGGGDFDIKVRILAQDAKTSTRKILEAFWINAKNPQLNRREECLDITRDLAPYLRVIFWYATVIRDLISIKEWSLEVEWCIHQPH